MAGSFKLTETHEVGTFLFHRRYRAVKQLTGHTASKGPPRVSFQQHSTTAHPPFQDHTALLPVFLLYVLSICSPQATPADIEFLFATRAVLATLISAEYKMV